MIEIFGYNKEDEEKNCLLTMQEICLQLSLEDIDELICFFEYVRKRHASLSDIAYCPHTHYSEWKKNMDEVKPEIVIATHFPQNKPLQIDISKE